MFGGWKALLRSLCAVCFQVPFLGDKGLTRLEFMHKSGTRCLCVGRAVSGSLGAVSRSCSLRKGVAHSIITSIKAAAEEPEAIGTNVGRGLLGVAVVCLTE